MSDGMRRTLMILAIAWIVLLALRGALSIAHDGLSPDWLWP